jgi:hypothetical protein
LNYKKKLNILKRNALDDMENTCLLEHLIFFLPISAVWKTLVQQGLYAIGCTITVFAEPNTSNCRNLSLTAASLPKKKKKIRGLRPQGKKENI